jgi:selenocysteine lyase/cysteine desulfurase
MADMLAYYITLRGWGNGNIRRRVSQSCPRPGRSETCQVSCATQFLLRPDVIFLNHGSFGACPKLVFEEYQKWQFELERQPVEFLGRRFNDLMREARRALAEYLCTQAGNLVCVTNATVGANIVARSLKLKEGDEVLSTNHEYGAMDRTWRFVCGKTGARYINHAPTRSNRASRSSSRCGAR